MLEQSRRIDNIEAKLFEVLKLTTCSKQKPTLQKLLEPGAYEPPPAEVSEKTL